MYEHDILQRKRYEYAPQNRPRACAEKPSPRGKEGTRERMRPGRKGLT